MYRFSVLPYVNALPLVHFLRQVCPQAELIYRTPRSSLDALLAGRADAALVPLVACFKCRYVLMVKGLGICSDGDVTSVLLQCQRPLREVRTVQLDPESRTSNTLVQVLLRDHFRIAHRVTYLSGVTAADARVCIGDRALCSRPAVETYDLAGEWKDMTGLPFVFAVWVARRSCPNLEEISNVLHRAKELGCRSVGTLARLAAERLSLPEDRCREYLTRRLHYGLGPREYQAIDLFRQLAAGVPGPEARRALPSASFGVQT